MSSHPPKPDENVASDMAAAEALAATPGAAPSGPLVPATACSGYPGDNNSSFLGVGKNFVNFPVDRNRGVYWFVAVDLTTQLNVVANVASDNSGAVPPEIKQLQGDPRYFFFVVGNNLRGHNVPVGELHTFLKAIGSGRLLAGLEQIATQAGTGTIFRYSYILAATATEGDLPGFEAFSDVHHVFLTMQFMPIRLDDKIVYAPVQQ